MASGQSSPAKTQLLTLVDERLQGVEEVCPSHYWVEQSFWCGSTHVSLKKQLSHLECHMTVYWDQSSFWPSSMACKSMWTPHAGYSQITASSLLYRQVKSNTDCDLLQQDLNSLHKWSMLWRISFKPSMYYIMHVTITRKYILRYYTTKGQSILSR